MITVYLKALITIGSAASVGFGIWHFFVPRVWNWYSYMKADATELILAVRVINIFFSLCLVLFGLMNILIAYAKQMSQYSFLVVLGATVILWTTRVVLQVVFPQGSTSPTLQYGMLSVFVIVLVCYLVPLILGAKRLFQ